MPRIPVTELTNKDKIYNLLVELSAAKVAKRETTKTANDELKRIQGEIDDLLEAEEDENGQAAPE